jgi:hypothetical protein
LFVSVFTTTYIFWGREKTNKSRIKFVTSDTAIFADEQLKSRLMTGSAKYQSQSDLVLSA